MAGRAEMQSSLWRVLAAAGMAVIFWQASSDVTVRWTNVPPPPRPETARLLSLGDTQFSYRAGALTLQTLGDGGGRVVPLKEYDYPMLGMWFDALDRLDPAADHVPMVAAYYFGASRVPGDVSVIVDFLARAGQRPVGEKWRWLAYAAYLARHRMDDLDRSLDLAYMLARMQPDDGKPLPLWAKQMPAFVLNAKGDTQSARALMEDMLATSSDLDPNEVRFLQGYLVDHLGVAPDEVGRIMSLRPESRQE